MFVCVHDLCHVGLVSLNLLDLSGNSFSTIPRHLPSSVEQLYLSNNSLTGLDEDSFEGFLNLKYLRLSHCGLQNRGVHSQVFNHSSLVELDLSYNKLTAIPTVPTTLQYLYLEANKIQGEDYTFSKACTDRCHLLHCRGVTEFTLPNISYMLPFNKTKPCCNREEMWKAFTAHPI